MRRRHTIQLLSLLVAIIGTTAAVLSTPDFRWWVLRDEKYRPAEPSRLTVAQVETPATAIAAPPGDPQRDPPTAVLPPPRPPTPPTRPATPGEWYEISPAMLRASSVLPPSRVASYEPEKVVDGRSNTVWVEDASGDGTGEWIEMDLAAPRRVFRLGVVNGYGKGPRFHENARVRSAAVTFSDGSQNVIHLSDNNELQYFNVGPATTMSVRLTIRSVYPGTRWTDAAIAEIRLWGRR